MSIHLVIIFNYVGDETTHVTDGTTPSRYDFILAVIPASLILATIAGAVSPVGMITALGLGSVPASGSMGYALFYRPPE